MALAMTSLRSGYRIAIVTPAQQMTHNAQNALLKTLEEPAAATLLILVTSRPSALAADAAQPLPAHRDRAAPESEARAWLRRKTARRTGARPARARRRFAVPCAGARAAFRASSRRRCTRSLEALTSGEAEVTAIAAECWARVCPSRLDWLEHLAGSGA